MEQIVIRNLPAGTRQRCGSAPHGTTTPPRPKPARSSPLWYPGRMLSQCPPCCAADSGHDFEPEPLPLTVPTPEM